MMTYKEYLAEHVTLDARVTHCEIQLGQAEDAHREIEQKYRDAGEWQREVLKPDLDTMREAVVDCGFQLADAEAKRKGFEEAHPEFNPPRDEDATPEKQTWSERVQEWKQAALGLQTLVAGTVIAASLNVSATLTDVSLPSPDAGPVAARSLSSEETPSAQHIAPSLAELEKQIDDWKGSNGGLPDNARVTSPTITSPDVAERLDRFQESVTDQVEKLHGIEEMVKHSESEPGGRLPEPESPEGPAGGGPSNGRSPTSPGELPDPDPPPSTLTRPPDDRKESGPSLDDSRRR